MQLKGKKITNVYSEKYSKAKDKIAQIDNIGQFKDNINKNAIGGNLIEKGIDSIGGKNYEYAILKIYVKQN